MHDCSTAGMRHASRREIGRKLARNVHSRLALLALASFAVLLSSCQPHDPITKEKQRTLSPDERYLVEYYMKLTQLRENLHDNPVELQEKQELLRSEADTARIRRTLEGLQKDPEHWLGIYNRINELRYRKTGGDTT